VTEFALLTLEVEEDGTGFHGPVRTGAPIETASRSNQYPYSRIGPRVSGGGSIVSSD
jgi:hypothetical protein